MIATNGEKNKIECISNSETHIQSAHSKKAAAAATPVTTISA